MQDNRDLFGFDRHRRNHSGSSSLGPAAIREELKYIHDDDDVIVKVCIVMFLHVLGFLMMLYAKFNPLEPRDNYNATLNKRSK